eukprot:355627-Chlamydomonas_euryale.AAC.3
MAEELGEAAVRSMVVNICFGGRDTVYVPCHDAHGAWRYTNRLTLKPAQTPRFSAGQQLAFGERNALAELMCCRADARPRGVSQAGLGSAQKVDHARANRRSIRWLACDCALTRSSRLLPPECDARTGRWRSDTKRMLCWTTLRNLAPKKCGQTGFSTHLDGICREARGWDHAHLPSQQVAHPSPPFTEDDTKLLIRNRRGLHTHQISRLNLQITYEFPARPAVAAVVLLSRLAIIHATAADASCFASDFVLYHTALEKAYLEIFSHLICILAVGIVLEVSVMNSARQDARMHNEKKAHQGTFAFSVCASVAWNTR